MSKEDLYILHVLARAGLMYASAHWDKKLELFSEEEVVAAVDNLAVAVAKANGECE